MRNFKQLPYIKAFQRFVLSYYPVIREYGKDQSQLDGSRDEYRSKIIPRVTVPNYLVDSSVILVAGWPISSGRALADALESFSKLEYNAVFRAPENGANRPVSAWGRLNATCDPDHHTVVQFEVWGEPEAKLGLMYSPRTSDLIGSFASDYLSATVIQTLLAAVFWREPGTLLFQGTIHYHATQEAILQQLQPEDVEVDWTRFTRWNELELPIWSRVLDDYHSTAIEMDSSRDRFNYLQVLAKSAAQDLRKGIL
jgi:hypothetical protein